MNNITKRALMIMQNLWLMLALIGTFSFGFLYIRMFHPKQHIVYNAISSDHMDFAITDISVKQFNQQGLLVNQLQAPYMQHLPDQQVHLFTRPQLLVAQEHQTPWDIQAEEAVAHPNKMVILKNNVTIQQQPFQQRPSTTLSTAELQYFFDKKQAITDKKVTIRQATSQLDAIGMKANLADNTIEFLSHVRGHYEPQRETHS